MAEFPSSNTDPSPRAANSVIGRPDEQPEDLDTQLSKGVDTAKDLSPGNENTALFPSHQCETLENEWRTIQTNFVDSPQDAVKQADALVNKTIDTLATSFGDMRASLERTWEREGEVSTEELRLAMQNYRSFFRRLLSI